MYILNTVGDRMLSCLVDDQLLISVVLMFCF